MRSRGNQPAQRGHSIQHQVLKYVTSHPEAKDTVEGIQQWWFGDSAIRVPTGELIAALDDLVVRGWITATELGGAATLYALNKDHLQEIWDWLESVKSRP